MRFSRQLRVVAVCSERLVDSLAPACHLLPVDLDAGRSDLRDAAANLLILDESALRDLDDEGLVQLAARAREAGAHTCAWISGDPDGPQPSAALRSELDGEFMADPAQAMSRPGAYPLPDAASQAALDAAWRPAPGAPVGLVIEPDVPWEKQLEPRLAVLLEAALEHPFEALIVEPRAAGIPPEIEAVASPGTERDRAAFIARCGVLIAGSPAWASRFHTPLAAFDAVAIGTPAIVPRGLGISLTLPRLTGIGSDAEVARELIETARRTGDVVPGWREAGMTSVRNEHTYRHRLATIASALGLAATPVS